MNNKGFAITTILYGTFLLFMMLLLAMLGILSRYKDNMDILIENTNGARDIVNPYNEGSFLMTIDGRNFLKANDGVAIIGYVYVTTDEGNFTGPILVSTVSNSVVYKTDCTDQACIDACSSGKCNAFPNTIQGKDGKKYYYSSSQLWMAGDHTETIELNDKFGWTNLGTISATTVDEAAKLAAEKLVKDKVKN